MTFPEQKVYVRNAVCFKCLERSYFYSLWLILIICLSGKNSRYQAHVNKPRMKIQKVLQEKFNITKDEIWE